MAKKMFKSESKRLLDLMINSIYTHKEIFLRELISNASDALDKLYYESLSNESISFDKDAFEIRLTADKEKRTLTVSDSGIGMTKEELEENLGTIAKSGSLAFKNENEQKDGVDIIGQFGVGFYSAFMVADKVEVTSKKFGTDEAFTWVSKGADGYEIKPAQKDGAGTTIVLTLKPNAEGENYDEFLEFYRIKTLVKRYSDYIKYPIRMLAEKQKPVEGKEGEFEQVFEDETLNSMVPLWRKGKSEISKEEYNNFYKEKFFDYADPLKTIHTSADGIISYNALMYIPSHPAYDYYTKEFKKGLQLYSNGVMIMDKCEDLLPDYFGFVKGLVDSQDLSLNISRETLQHDRQLKAIAGNLKKKIKSELENMLKNDRESYEAFFESFKRPLKFGVYDNFGAEKDFLIDLLMFYSSSENKMSTLKEYVERMKEGQEFIYYASGESIERIEKLPQVEAVTEQGYEVLYLTEDVDEFALKIVGKFEEKEFKSVSSSDLKLGEDKKEEEEKLESANKELFDLMKEALGDKVSAVKPSVRLKSHPVCISSEGELSIEMEKVLNSMPGNNNVKAQRVLEVNTEHKTFGTLTALMNEDKDKLKKLTEVLYNMALLMEGLSVEDPSAFVSDVCDLME